MVQGNNSYGMVGLGTMGWNLVLNIADHGFSIAGYDKDITKVEALNQLAAGKKMQAFSTIEEFVASLSSPRIVMLLVPAGPIVDAVIFELKALLEPGDVIIDLGNSHFVDTTTRVENLSKDNLHFMGIGISGGETGARMGPSIMPGGDKEVYTRIAPMLEAIAAKWNGLPCTGYMGAGAAGHYVKMVHNGIEYALMQLLAESYHLLKVAGGFNNDQLHDTYTRWNNGRLRSFLVEITAAIFKQEDEQGKGRLVDQIADTAHQKGTGAWMSQDAMKIQSPIPAIDAAVSQRILSSLKKQRVFAAGLFKEPDVPPVADPAKLATDLEEALYAAVLVTYAQGLAMLQQGSITYNLGTDLVTVAGIWRGGCIIRADVLNDIMEAFKAEPNLANLMLAPAFAKDLARSQATMRTILSIGLNARIPLPAFGASINYYDSYHSEWLPANLVQAQRDFFGAHTYERIDMEGVFHTSWNETIQ